MKHMINNMDIDDIIENETLLKNNNLIEELSSEKLKKIADSNISASTKHEIAKSILTWRVNPADPQHKAFGWMGKNAGEWLQSDVRSSGPSGKTYSPA